MNDRRDVAYQIGKIKDIFQQALEAATAGENVPELIDRLEAADPEFRSIAYEGASMGLALKDIAAGESLTQWRSLLESGGARHSTQIHVGLGWAMAQERHPVSLLRGLHPLLRFRVLDGYGYYDGFFRSRKAIREQLRPPDLPENYHTSYDQGLGRSIWYTCGGNPSGAIQSIEKFDAARRPDLWRGTGIACSYVGGFEKNTLTALTEASSEHHIQLSVGAALAARVRTQANCMTDDAENACREWCKCSGAAAAMLTIKAEPGSIHDLEDSFKIWISKIESALVSAQ